MRNVSNTTSSSTLLDQLNGTLTHANILVIEDDRDALEVLVALLHKHDCTIGTAGDGETGLRLAEEHWNELDVILLDIMMPGGLDGYAVCEQLKSNPRTREIPIIVLSARGSPQDIARSYAAGAMQHITKPYDSGHLTAVVASMVRTRDLEREAFGHAAKYQAILDHLPLELVIVAPDMTILEMNRNFDEDFPDVRIGDHLLDTFYDEPPEMPGGHPVELTFKTGLPETDVITGQHNGKTIVHSLHTAPLLDEHGEIHAVVLIANDITQQSMMEDDLRRQVERHNRALQQQDKLADRLMDVQRTLKERNLELEEAKALLEKLSVTDDLTKLYNKRHYEEAIRREARRSSRYKHPLSLLILDIDHFKQVNDTYGHPSGDAVLRVIGEILHEQLRETDTVIRYGGEEFVVILPETEILMAERISERIRQAVAAHTFQIPEGKTISITVSIGVATVHSKTIEPVQLFDHADKALYEAKENGRNRIVVAPVESD